MHDEEAGSRRCPGADHCKHGEEPKDQEHDEKSGSRVIGGAKSVGADDAACDPKTESHILTGANSQTFPEAECNKRQQCGGDKQGGHSG